MYPYLDLNSTLTLIQVVTFKQSFEVVLAPIVKWIYVCKYVACAEGCPIATPPRYLMIFKCRISSPILSSPQCLWLCLPCALGCRRPQETESFTMKVMADLVERLFLSLSGWIKRWHQLIKIAPDEVHGHWSVKQKHEDANECKSNELLFSHGLDH